MKRWPTKPLGGLLVTLESGSRPKGGVGEIPDGIPSLGGEHINRNGGFVWETPKHVTQDFYVDMKRGRIQRGDILVVKDGATTGKTATVRDNFPFREAAINEHVFLLRTDKAKALPEFVGYFLFGPVGQQQILSSFRGSTIGGIAQDFVHNVHVPVPPLAEQKRIVKLLDEADELRELRTQADRRIAALIPALFHDMFGNPETNPKNWKVVRLEEVTTRITDGVHLKPNYVVSGVPFISVKNITTGSLNFNDCKFISQDDHEKFTRRCKPEYLDILYTKVGATYGRPALIETTNEFSIYVSVCLIKPIKSEIDPHFLAAALGTTALKRQAGRSIKGIGVPDLHLDQIQKFILPLPPLPLQKEFAERVTKIRGLEAEQAASRSRLDSLFHSLLHGAFAGEL